MNCTAAELETQGDVLVSRGGDGNRGSDAARLSSGPTLVAVLGSDGGDVVDGADATIVSSTIVAGRDRFAARSSTTFS